MGESLVKNGRNHLQEEGKRSIPAGGLRRWLRHKEKRCNCTCGPERVHSRLKGEAGRNSSEDRRVPPTESKNVGSRPPTCPRIPTTAPDNSGIKEVQEMIGAQKKPGALQVAGAFLRLEAQSITGRCRALCRLSQDGRGPQYKRRCDNRCCTPYRCHRLSCSRW